MKQLIHLFALVVLFSSCDNKTATSETDNLYKFKDYISYTTYGNKSVTAPISIELMQQH